VDDGEDGLTYHGREGVREAFQRWLESFEDYRGTILRRREFYDEDEAREAARPAE
jgi:hypothetical protein